MSFTCHQCGLEQVDGTAFCRQCGAPQIRVLAPEGAAGERTEPESEETQDVTTETAAGRIDRRLARSRALISAFAMIVPMALPPLAILFPIWMLLGGGLCVYLYLRRDAQAQLSLGEGARMGLMSGLLAFLLLTLLTGSGLAYEILIEHKAEQVLAPLREQIQHTLAANPDPQVTQLGQRFLTPDGMALLAIVSWLFLFLLFLVFCSLGGGLGAYWLGRRKNP